MSVYCVENVSTASTYIALDALEILMSSMNSINIYSNDGMVENPSVSASKTFCRLKSS